MMDSWVLYFFLFFINGETIMLENHERFETEERCYFAGIMKGPHLLEQTAQMFGIPAQGSFTCQSEGQDV